MKVLSLEVLVKVSTGEGSRQPATILPPPTFAAFGVGGGSVREHSAENRRKRCPIGGSVR